MNHLNWRGTVPVLATALLLCACGKSGDAVPPAASLPQEKTAAPAASSDVAPAGTAALREFIDPATGLPREPTAADIKALEGTAPTQSNKPAAAGRPRDKEIVFPNGTVAVAEESLSHINGCIQPDGTIVVDHQCGSAAPLPKQKP